MTSSWVTVPSGPHGKSAHEVRTTFWNAYLRTESFPSILLWRWDFEDMERRGSRLDVRDHVEPGSWLTVLILGMGGVPAAVWPGGSAHPPCEGVDIRWLCPELSLASLVAAAGNSITAAAHDPQIYLYHDVKGELQLIKSSHVDGLKSGGENSVYKKVLNMIGKMKRQRDRFECIGIMPEQDSVMQSLWTQQQHHVPQLRPLPEDQGMMGTEDSQLSVASHGTHMSLLGSITWMTQTMVLIVACVGYLQINRLLKRIMANVKQLGVRSIVLDTTQVRRIQKP